MSVETGVPLKLAVGQCGEASALCQILGMRNKEITSAPHVKITSSIFKRPVKLCAFRWW